VFEIVKTSTGYASTPTTLVSFSGDNGVDPPRGSLIADAAGDLFGTTGRGGANGDGTVFELSNTGFQTSVVSNASGKPRDPGGTQRQHRRPGRRLRHPQSESEPIATASSAYTLSPNGDGTFNVATTGSSDHVSGVLQVAFSDKTVTVAQTNSQAEYIAMLYQGALDRTPDAPGLASWIKIYAAAPASTQAIPGAYGLSDGSAGYNGSLSLAGGFTNSPEFMAKYGSLTNAQFVTNLYANVLDRPPDTAGFNNWISLLNSGTSREHVLVGFADSAEAITDATMGSPARVALTPRGCC